MPDETVNEHQARTALLLIADSLRVVAVAGWEVAGMLEDLQQRQAVRHGLDAIGHTARVVHSRVRGEL